MALTGTHENSSSTHRPWAGAMPGGQLPTFAFTSLSHLPVLLYTLCVEAASLRDLWKMGWDGWFY